MGQPLLFTYLITQWLLQVRCREVDVGGRRCRWTGRRDQLNSHQHDYDQPADEQHQSALAGRKRAAESHDEEPSAKAVRVDVSGTTQTSTVPAGAAGVQTDESSSVRDTAASVAEPRQPNTNDPRHIRANDDHEDEETEPKEQEEDWNEIVDLLRVAAADLDRPEKWEEYYEFYCDFTDAVAAVIDAASDDEVAFFVLSLI